MLASPTAHRCLGSCQRYRPVPPSLLPSRPPPGWDQWSQRGCRGSRSGAPGTAAAPCAWPGGHQAGTTSALLPDRVSTGAVVARTAPQGLSDAGAAPPDAAGPVSRACVVGGSPMGLRQPEGLGQHGASRHPPQCLR